MMNQQQKGQRDAAALQQAVMDRGNADVQHSQQVWQALAREHAPELLAALTTARQALDEAGADLQEVRHQLKAAELGTDEQAEAVAIVRVRRAERRHAEAQQAAQQAEQALTAAVVRVRDDLHIEGLHEYNRRLRAVHEVYQQRQRDLDQWAQEREAEMNAFEAEHITPLIEAGAAPARRVVATGLFVTD
jgi:hypothetical protein